MCSGKKRSWWASAQHVLLFGYEVAFFKKLFKPIIMFFGESILKASCLNLAKTSSTSIITDPNLSPEQRIQIFSGIPQKDSPSNLPDRGHKNAINICLLMPTCVTLPNLLTSPANASELLKQSFLQTVTAGVGCDFDKWLHFLSADFSETSQMWDPLKEGFQRH